MIFVIPNPLNTLTIIQVTKNQLNERKEMFVHMYIWTFISIPNPELMRIFRM